MRTKNYLDKRAVFVGSQVGLYHSAALMAFTGLPQALFYSLGLPPGFVPGFFFGIV